MAQIVKASRKQSLKDKLDAIDERVTGKVVEGYYQSRLLICLAMWDKGKAIDAFFTGVENTPTYYQLEQETGRRRANLKQWHKLYEKYPEKQDYLPTAEARARRWAEKALAAGASRANDEHEPGVAHDGVVYSLDELLKKGVKFQTVYADPPWGYDNQGTRAATDKHYKTLAVDQICELPVEQLVENNAHLHLWTTNAFLFEAKQVMEAWGFEYKSVLLWVKPQLGIGNYWRVCHEFLLFGLRGKLTMRDARKKKLSWLQHDRLRHSAKPAKFRKLVEEVSYPERLEMFGREAHKGWWVYGDEIVGAKMFDERIRRSIKD
ncbi:MAG: MT-A70 family methyltransferase [Planctomycetota bacterium]|jgi:N6-adenosine-specific RNA methylase IME4